MTVSACALMLFLFRVAWQTWRTATLVMSFLAGVIVSLQYLVYGIHSLARLAARAVGAGRRLVLRAVARRTTTIDTEVGTVVGDAVEKTPQSPFSPPPCAIGEALAQLPPAPVLAPNGVITEEPVQEEDVGARRIPVS
jgi:hypothetical protein